MYRSYRFHAAAWLITILSAALLPIITLLPLQKGSVDRIIDGITFRNYSITYEGIRQQHNVWCMDYNSSNGSDPKQQLLQCIPSVIIAGTQKSGTTVLAALLSDHPNVSFSLQKEVHYFDVDRNYNKGVVYYLKHFKPLTINLNSNIDDIQLPLVAEATPFYIASRQACSRIAELQPDTKLIVLLREPVARAYSEYQMKKRRVDKQGDFLRSIHHYKWQVYQCMRSHPRNLIEIARCVPSDLSSHVLWHKLVTAWRRSLAHYQDWNAVVNSCFRFREDIYGYRWSGAVGLDGTALGVFDAPIEEEQQRGALNNTSWQHNTYTSSIADFDTPSFNQMDRGGQSASTKIVFGRQQVDSGEDPSYYVETDDCTATTTHRVLQFLELSCWNQSRSLYEYLLPMEHGLIDEVEAFRECSQRLVQQTGSEAGGDDSHLDR